jgi:hypothetical protein
VRRLAAVALALGLAGAAAGAPPAKLPERAPGETPNDYLARIARAAAPGLYPRWLLGEQSYWTVVGVPIDEKEAALSEDGAIEVEKEAFSIEPFLFVGPEAAGAGGEASGRLLTWRDVRASQELLEGDLPIPSVRWEHAGEGGKSALALTVRAYAAGPPGRSSLFASYRVENRGSQPVSGSLILAVRPLQVVSAWQFLNLAPGFSPIHELGFDEGALRVNVEKEVLLLTPADGFGAGSLQDGEPGERLLRGALPARSSARDPEGFVSGALRFRFDLAPGAQRDVHLEVPFYRERAPFGRRARARRAQQPRLDPGAPRRPEAPARLAQLRALLDPRRRADLGRAARLRLLGRGARVPALVRALPVRRRQDPLLHRRPRR